jgi:hypothetical protein
MRIGLANRDRLWLLGGAIVALLLVLMTYLLIIKGQSDKTNSVKDEVASAQDQVIASNRQLNQLKADSANLDKYKAALATHQSALPANPGLPAFLRELHQAGDQAGVGIASLTVADPTAVTDASATGNSAAASSATGSTATATSNTFSIAISVVATGPSANLTAFIKQLQAVQPRALLVSSVDISPGNAVTHTYQLNLGFSVFVQSTDGSVPTAN